MLAVHSFFGSVPADAATQAVPAVSMTWHVALHVVVAHRLPACATAQLPLRQSESFTQLAPVVKRLSASGGGASGPGASRVAPSLGASGRGASRVAPSLRASGDRASTVCPSAGGPSLAVG